MPKPKEPTKSKASRNRVDVGAAPDPKSGQSTKVAKRTKDPGDTAPTTPGKAKFAPRSKNNAAAGTSITRPTGIEAEPARAERNSEAEVGGGSEGSGGDANTHFVPLDAVLDVGECYNTIRFHLIQDQLLWDEEHRDEARLVLVRLGRLVRRLVPVRERSRLRDQVVSPIGRLIDDLGKGQRYENLNDTNNDLWDRFPDVDLSRYRRKFVEPVDGAIRGSRGIIESLLKDDGLALLVLQLGETLDQWVHPVDPDNFYVPIERPTVAVGFRSLVPGVVRDASHDRREDLLANRSLWEGDVPPAESWADEVRSFLEESPMIESAPVGHLTPQARRATMGKRL